MRCAVDSDGQNVGLRVQPTRESASARCSLKDSLDRMILRKGSSVSMSRENESLNWKHQRLDAQEQGVHKPDGIHPVQDQPPCGAHFRGGGQEFMVAAVGIHDATAARDYPLEAAVVERLEEDQDGSRSCNLL